MKVFVLICESMYDGGNQEISCAVYEKRETAIEHMRQEFDETQTDWDGETFVHEIEEDGGWAQHYDEDYPNETHIKWDIFEQKIIKGEEEQ